MAAEDIVACGRDFAVHQRVTSIPAPDGSATLRTNRFTVVENALHYFRDGRWHTSRDLIEPFPQGAIARDGPHQAIFSPDLAAPAVFDLQMADGGRLRGGPRALQLTEVKTGRSVVLATIRPAATGELAGSDRLVYRDAFDGLQADLVLVWRHNAFSQDIVLRQRPRLPAGWDPASTRFEVLTEFVEAPEPQVRRQTVGPADASFFYFAWCDRSLSSWFGGNSRPDPNIRFARIYP